MDEENKKPISEPTPEDEQQSPAPQAENVILEQKPAEETPPAKAGYQEGLPPEVVQKMEKQPSGEQKPKDQKELKKPKKPKKFPVAGCLIGFVFLYILSIVLGIFVLWINKDNPDFLGNFGFINDVELKSFILTAVQWSFFPITLIFLILTVVGVFILASAKKDQPDKRKKGISMTLINVFMLFIIIPIWVGVYNFVASLPVSAERIRAEILISPEDTSKLIAPVIIDFSIDNILKVMQRKNLNIVSVAWDFDGDGEYETETLETVIKHQFKSSGAFTVSVKVSLDNNTEAVYSKKIIIPQAGFDAKPSEGPSPLEVTFDAGDLTSGLEVSTYRWDFDNDAEFDKETSDATVTHTFEKLGDYTIVLQTIDANDNVKNYSRDIKVFKGKLEEFKAIIKATPDVEGGVPFQVQFNGADSELPEERQIKRYEWNFGDGSPVKTGEKVNYVFKKAGKYPVELSITDDEGNRVSTTLKITAKAPLSAPEAVIDTNPPFDPKSEILNGTVPFKVAFDADKSIDKDNNIKNYAWDFDGDDKIDTFGSTETHIYREAGTYTVTLTVTDADEQLSSANITINVREHETKAIISAEPEAGPAPLTVDFDASQSTTADGSKIVSFEWDFGDGVALPTGAITSHKYDKVGNYRVRLKISSATNETAEAEKMIFVRVVPLQACFEPSRTTGKHPLSVRFDPGCSTGTIKKWSWKFGDGFTSVNRIPTHTFKNAGNYTVTMEIVDNKNTVSEYSQLINVQ